MMKSRNLLFIGMLVFMQGCYEKFDKSESNDTREPVTEGGWYKPETNITWDWQMHGDVDSDDNITLYVVDLFDLASDNVKVLDDAEKRVMCMFHSGQVDSNDADYDKFLPTPLGNIVENTYTSRWLDINNSFVLNAMKLRIDKAKQENCDGVVPMDADMFKTLNKGIEITAQQQLQYNQDLANYAHDQNLTIGLMEDKTQVYSLEPFYDFVLVRNCYASSDCDSYTPFIGNDKPVFDAELNSTYHTDDAERKKLCDDAKSRKFNTIIISSDLNGTYRDACN